MVIGQSEPGAARLDSNRFKRQLPTEAQSEYEQVNANDIFSKQTLRDKIAFSESTPVIEINARSPPALVQQAPDHAQPHRYNHQY